MVTYLEAFGLVDDVELGLIVGAASHLLRLLWLRDLSLWMVLWLALAEALALGRLV